MDNKMWPGTTKAGTLARLPYGHVALYKHGWKSEIFGATEALPLSTLSTVPDKSVALARRSL